jgi:hypothetical protein
VNRDIISLDLSLSLSLKHGGGDKAQPTIYEHANKHEVIE